MTPPRIRVLIVDDHPLVRDGLASMLRQHDDIEIGGLADNAASALALAAAAPPDVAVVDLTLKGRSGFDLIKDLAEHHPDTAVLVLSMHEELTYVERALRAGAAGYIMKGEDTRHIAEAVRQVHAGQLYANPTLLARLTERMIGRANPSASDATESLSDREMDIFQRIGQGFTTRRIATDLQISMKTVQAHCANIKDKLGLASATELLRAAVRWYESHQPA